MLFNSSYKRKGPWSGVSIWMMSSDTAHKCRKGPRVHSDEDAFLSLSLWQKHLIHPHIARSPDLFSPRQSRCVSHTCHAVLVAWHYRMGFKARSAPQVVTKPNSRHRETESICLLLILRLNSALTLTSTTKQFEQGWPVTIQSLLTCLQKFWKDRMKMTWHYSGKLVKARRSMRTRTSDKSHVSPSGQITCQTEIEASKLQNLSLLCAWCLSEKTSWKRKPTSPTSKVFCWEGEQKRSYEGSSEQTACCPSLNIDASQWWTDTF